MANEPYEPSAESHTYFISPEMTSALYDRTSCTSSARSPMNPITTYDNVYTSNSYMLPYNAFSLPYPMYSEEHAPSGLISMKLDVDSLYKDFDRRRKKGSSDKPVSSHAHSRRRAQNRASQRAFRDRKEKHIKDLERKLEELEGRHSGLSKSYESLQQEYSIIKSELGMLRQENSRVEKDRQDSCPNQSSENDPLRELVCDPILFQEGDLVW